METNSKFYFRICWQIHILINRILFFSENTVLSPFVYIWALFVNKSSLYIRSTSRNWTLISLDSEQEVAVVLWAKQLKTSVQEKLNCLLNYSGPGRCIFLMYKIGKVRNSCPRSYFVHCGISLGDLSFREFLLWTLLE